MDDFKSEIKNEEKISSPPNQKLLHKLAKEKKRKEFTERLRNQRIFDDFNPDLL